MLIVVLKSSSLRQNHLDQVLQSGDILFLKLSIN